MPSKGGKKFYAVAVGILPGIYRSWAECEAQVKGFPKAKFKSFKKLEEAEEFIKNSVEKDGTAKRPPSHDDLSSVSHHKRRRMHTAIVHMQIHIMFDGGSRGNPGVAGAGAILTTQQTPPMPWTADSSPSSTATLHWQNRKVTRIREYMPGRGITNNQAEYQGLCMALLQAKSDIDQSISAFYQQTDENRTRADDPDQRKTAIDTSSVAWKVNLIVQGDSQLVLRQLDGEYQCLSEGLQPYLAKAKSYINSIKQTPCGGALQRNDNTTPKSESKPSAQMDNIVVELNTTLEHVLRKFNTEADSLANQAMDAKRSWKTVTLDGVEQTDE